MESTGWLQDSYRSTRSLTIALDKRDAYTRQHCDRVVKLATLLGAALALDQDELAILEISGTFHDLGKIGIPDTILHKPGRLDSGEWETMKTHSELGEHIVQATGLPAAKRVAKAIRHHHENFAGDGYPDRLEGDRIPLLSRIIFMADAYDAMRNPRAYRPAMSHEQVMSILDSENGWKFDPAIHAEFINLVST